MRQFVPFVFPYVSADHKEFFHQVVHETGSAYPSTIAALYLLSACAETREHFGEIMDPDGHIKDDCWDIWQDEDIPGFDGSRSPATRAQTAAALMAYAQSQGQRPAQGEADSMVLLPGGTFTMGSPDSERLRDADETAHQVTVSSFYIDSYEVTQADYERIMGTNPSHFNGADLPVDSVTWYDAIEYCNKLSVSRGLTPAYI